MSNSSCATQKLSPLGSTTSIGFLKRLLILIYDGLLLLAVVLVAFAALFSIIPQGMESMLIIKIIKILYIFSIGFLFYGWFWTHGGQTLGMKTWNLYLIDDNGKFIDWKRAFIRYVAAIFSWALCGLGFTWILVSKKNLAWHDSLSKTRIVFHKPIKKQ